MHIKDAVCATEHNAGKKNRMSRIINQCSFPSANKKTRFEQSYVLLSAVREGMAGRWRNPSVCMSGAHGVEKGVKTWQDDRPFPSVGQTRCMQAQQVCVYGRYVLP